MRGLQDYLDSIRQLSREKEAVLRTLQLENERLHSTIAQQTAQGGLGGEGWGGRGEGLVRELEAARREWERMEELEKEKLALEKEVR